jgi:hypothetical protein
MLTDMNIPLIVYRHRQVSKTDGPLYEKSEKYIKLFIKVIKLHHSLPKPILPPSSN